MRVRSHPGQSNEQGVVLTLIAVFMLFVVGAMAVLAIDVVSFYTARSEAQLAADGAALAGARVLANSGMTSSTDPTLASNAATLCSTIAKQVAQSNLIGGQAPTTGNITVTCNTTTQYNPSVAVQVKANVPTFFARIWGSTQITVSGKAAAEAYNPSNLAATTTPPSPVATTCVKPWLLPNISPSSGNAIINPTTGVIDTTLLGWTTPAAGGADRLRTDCTTTCGNATPPPPLNVWRYYPGDPADFVPPSAASVVCPTCTNNYERSIAGCVPVPITCNQVVHVDVTSDTTRDANTGVAVDALTHSSANEGDSIDTTATPSPPFQFLAGSDNPLVQSGSLPTGSAILVSDSLVTVPVIDTSSWPPVTTTYPAVQIVGFVQLFLNPTGFAAPFSGHIHTTVTNVVGCGTGATGTPTIIGNGPSAVPVRLITPP